MKLVVAQPGVAIEEFAVQVVWSIFVRKLHVLIDKEEGLCDDTPAFSMSVIKDGVDLACNNISRAGTWHAEEYE